jgi:hypothetical protein
MGAMPGQKDGQTECTAICRVQNFCDKIKMFLILRQERKEVLCRGVSLGRKSIALQGLPPFFLSRRLTRALTLSIPSSGIDCFSLVDVARPTDPRANNALISLVDTFRVEEPPMQRCGRGMLPGL